jgi:hypothetical protein
MSSPTDVLKILNTMKQNGRGSYITYNGRKFFGRVSANIINDKIEIDGIIYNLSDANIPGEIVEGEVLPSSLSPLDKSTSQEKCYFSTTRCIILGLTLSLVLITGRLFYRHK